MQQAWRNAEHDGPCGLYNHTHTAGRGVREYGYASARNGAREVVHMLTGLVIVIGADSCSLSTGCVIVAVDQLESITEPG
jgi:hypothetical protein